MSLVPVSVLGFRSLLRGRALALLCLVLSVLAFLLTIPSPSVKYGTSSMLLVVCNSPVFLVWCAVHITVSTQPAHYSVFTSTANIVPDVLDVGGWIEV